MQKLDFIQLIEQRLATLEARLTQLVDHRLTEEVKKTISIARIDLPFSLAKARYVLELVIRDIYQRELPQEKPKPLFNMIEALCQIEGLFTRKLVADVNYIRINGNLMVHAQEGTVEVQERDVEVIMLVILNLVEWYLVSYMPAKSGATLAPPVVQAIPPNPYRGLAAFREEDSAVFFGRDKDADDLVARVTVQPLVALIGASGSGKSSLVQAGLFPRLRKQGQWRLVAFRPQNRPFYELATVMAGLLYEDKLERAEKTKDFAEKLANGQVELATLVELALEKQPQRLLLVVDQFEELYTLNPDPALQQRFVEVLLGGLALLAAPAGAMASAGQSGGASGLCLLVTLRADFMARALACAPLARALDQYAPKLLGPIDDADDLRAVIEQPARRLEIAWEPLLIERILRDLRAQPAGVGEAERISLPLLQFTLEQLWQKQTERTLTHLAYEELGGVQRALARHADTVLTHFDTPAQERLRHIFTQLVCPGEGTEDTRQVATRTQVGEANWDLVSRLADERLVVTRGDVQGQDTVELIHEALIRHWPPLQQWVAQNRQFRVWQNRLRLDLQEWQQHGNDASALLRGARLAEAEERLHQQADALSPSEQAYIQAGIAEREREERVRRRGQRRLIGGLAAGLVVVSVLAGFAFVKRNQAEQASQEANKQRSEAQLRSVLNENMVSRFLSKPHQKVRPLNLLEQAAQSILNCYAPLSESEMSANTLRQREAVLINNYSASVAKNDLKEGMEACRQALEIAQQLTTKDPANNEWQGHLAVSYLQIGDVWVVKGQLREALSAYRQATDIMQRLVAQDSINSRWQRDLAVSHLRIRDVLATQSDAIEKAIQYSQMHRMVYSYQQVGGKGAFAGMGIGNDILGNFLVTQGQLEMALIEYRRFYSYRIHRPPYQQLLDKPTNYYYLLNQLRIGDVFAAQRRLSEALEVYSTILEWEGKFRRFSKIIDERIGDVLAMQGKMSEALAAYQRINNTFPFDQPMINLKIGDALVAQGQLAEALVAYRRAFEIRGSGDWRDYPSLFTYGLLLSDEDRAIGYLKIGDLLAAQGDDTGAGTAYRQALAITSGFELNQLGDAEPAVLAGMLNKFTFREVYYNSLSKDFNYLAQPIIEKALAIRQRLAQQEPTSVERQYGLVDTHLKISWMRQQQGDLTGSQASYKAALAITERLSQQDPANAQQYHNLAGHIHYITGERRQNENDLAGALTAYQAALAIAEQLVQQNPANAQWQDNLTASHEQIGAVRQAQGDLAGALAAYQAALTIRQEYLVNARQQNEQQNELAEKQEELAFSHVKIGEVRQAQGDLAGALIAYQTALAIAKQLEQEREAGWKSALMVIHDKIGALRQAQGDLVGALVDYQAALAIRQGLLTEDDFWRGLEFNVQLAVNYERLGDLHAQQGDLVQARSLFEREFEIVREEFKFGGSDEIEAILLNVSVYTRLTKVFDAQGDTQAKLAYQRRLLERSDKLTNKPDWSLDLRVTREALTITREFHAKQQNDASRRFLAQILGSQSLSLLLDRQFQEAIAAAEDALALAPDKLWIATNQAHGYLLSGQFEKAEAIYRQHAEDKVNDWQTFAEAVLRDFDKLRERGIDHPDMKKIEALLRTSRGQP